MDWPQYPPQRTNRGSTPAPREVIGRQGFIDHLWHTLDRQSVLLTAQRRLGKSSILIVMAAEPRDGTLVIKRDLENVRTPVEFVERLLDDVQPHLSTWKRGREGFGALLKAVGGVEVAGAVKLPPAQSMHWKTHLEAIMCDLLADEERRVVFLWDEMPWMLDNIRRQRTEPGGELAAMEMLDTLRALRQRHRNLRMVFTGSVGLHHVLGSLQRAGHGNAATNDMLFRDLPALSREDAMGLAWSLLQGEALSVQSPEIVVPAIADVMDCLPYYIHHLVGRLADDFQTVIPEMIERTVIALLTDPQDPCGMRNYEVRIKRYYLAEHQLIAFGLLDLLARADHSFPDLCNLLRHQQKRVNEETVRDVLYLLASDHYVLQDESGAYAFRFRILARAWRIRRGLRP